jgi:hypothetical protein
MNFPMDIFSLVLYILFKLPATPASRSEGLVGNVGIIIDL